MRGAETDRNLEILAHPHAEIRQALFSCELGQKRKMGAGIFVRRRNAHEPFHGKLEFIAREADEFRGVAWRDAGLLRLLARVDLNQHDGRACHSIEFGPIDLGAQRVRKLRAVERLDPVEKLHRLARLVRLQRADQMQLDVGKLRAQCGPFALGLLHPVLSEDAMALRQYRHDLFDAMGLGDGHKRGRRRRFHRRLSRGLDARENGVQLERRIRKFGHDGKGHPVAGKLARLAFRLNRGALPPLVLMTDDERLPDPHAAASHLPRGSLIVLRAREKTRRRDLAASLARIAGQRGLYLLIADDPELACSAHGAHFPEARAGEIAQWRARRPRLFLTASAHSLCAAMRAATFGADAVFLSPVFPTKSHPERAALGAMRLRLIAACVPVPIYALGGIDETNVLRLTGARLAGIAAIGVLAA